MWTETAKVDTRRLSAGFGTAAGWVVVEGCHASVRLGKIR